jgi:hypothetical protein
MVIGPVVQDLLWFRPGLFVWVVFCFIGGAGCHLQGFSSVNFRVCNVQGRGAKHGPARR